MKGNTLFYGDNLHVLREHVPEASVDLVYLDPPFQSGKDYNVIFERSEGQQERAQTEAFTDTWSWGLEAEEMFADMERLGGHVAKTLRALRTILGESDMMAYLCMMAPRLVELRRVLKPTGSLYLHCDPTASHYLKIVLDAVFGPACFRNEVIWRYRRWPAPARRYQRMHDVLLFYTARSGTSHTFHALTGYEKLAESTVRTYGTKKQKADFSSGHRKPGVEEEDSPGPVLSDVWEVGILAPVAKERTGYPTQKPEALLERLILSSTNEGDVVLDPFCGCGTAISVAEKFKRRWIGIDITHLAVNIMRDRMQDAKFEVVGEPVDLEGARQLAEDDAYQFQWWILGRVGARPPAEKRKKGKDGGVDGEILFRDLPGGAANQKLVISVKSGKNSVAHVRDLRGVLERDGAAIGALLVLNEPTKDMIAEAAKAGFHTSHNGRHARLQIVTAKQILSGQGIDFPGSGATTRGKRRSPPKQEQLLLTGLASTRPAAAPAAAKKKA